MCDIRMFRAAKLDYDAAYALYKVPYEDEEFVNRCAYFLQQSVEKTLKAFLECKGIAVPSTHNIDKLLRMSETNGSAAIITDWIILNSEMLSSWEAETRYNFDYIVQKVKLEIGFREVKKFLEVNGLRNQLLPEITDEVKKAIRKCIPDRVTPQSDFDWNCYYKTLLSNKKKQI